MVETAQEKRFGKISRKVRQRTDQPLFSRLKRKGRKKRTRRISRKGAKVNELSFRPKGEIFLRSLAFARDDGPRPVTFAPWRLCGKSSDFFFASFALFAVRESGLRSCLDKATSDLVAFTQFPQATEIKVYYVIRRRLWGNFGI